MAYKNIPNRPGWQFKDNPTEPTGNSPFRPLWLKQTGGVRTTGSTQVYTECKKTDDPDGTNRGEISATFYNKEVKPASFFSALPAVGGGAGINPDFANVVALVNATGDVSGSFLTLYATDASNQNITVSARNGLATEAHDGVTKFQSFAMEGNGSTYLLDAFSNGVTGGMLGSGEFTMECWCYPIENGNFELMSTRQSAIQQTGSGIGLMMNTTTNELRLIRGNTENATSGTALNIGAWNHVAVSRDASNNVRAFVNGALGLTVTDTQNYVDEALTIMEAQAYNGGARWKGYVEDVRITKGECLYTEAFSPPTEAFPTS